MAEYKLAVVVSHRRGRFVNASIGRANHGAITHRDHVIQTFVFVKEGKHPFAGTDTGDDEMDALGVGNPVIGRDIELFIELVDPWPGGVHNGACPHGSSRSIEHVAQMQGPLVVVEVGVREFGVVRRQRTTVESGLYETERETGIVVWQVGIGIGECAFGPGCVDERFDRFDCAGP